jgi:hypothetical protein
MADSLSGLGTERSFFGKIDFDYIEKLLLDYGKEFQSMAQGQLRRANKVSTGALSDSIKYIVKRTKNGYELNIEVLDYYKFIDKGVQGTGPGSRNTSSPYKYKDKMPPIKSIIKWMKTEISEAKKEDQKYKLSKRQKKSRSVKAMSMEMKRKTLAFLIARKIKRRGLPYTGFWERSFEKTFQDLDVKLAQASGLNIRSNFENLIKEIKTKR